MAIGILGGTFDPPHNGGVALARAALDQLDLDGLLVLVIADPGHKTPHASAEVRLELARLAFEGDSRIQVELDPHPRTVDSLEARKLLDPVLVIGSDQLVDFSTWKRSERVLELARLAVAMRSGVPDEHALEAHARLPSPDRISFFALDPVPVSSTLVRERVARGQSIADLVPPPVADAIRRLGLYAPAE